MLCEAYDGENLTYLELFLRYTKEGTFLKNKRRNDHAFLQFPEISKTIQVIFPSNLNMYCFAAKFVRSLVTHNMKNVFKSYQDFRTAGQ